MFHMDAAFDVRTRSTDNVLSTEAATMEVLGAKAALSEARQRRLAAERALDAVLADSFPASDPPPWTLGVSLSTPAISTPVGTISTGSVEDGRATPGEKR